MFSRKRLAKLEALLAPQDASPMKTLVCKYPDGSYVNESYAEVERIARTKHREKDLLIVVCPDEETAKLTERVVNGELPITSTLVL